MEFQIRYTRSRASVFPCASEFFDRLTKSIEHLWTSIGLSKRPFQPFAHVAFQDWDSAAVSSFRFASVQRDEALFPIDLAPFPCEQLAQSDAGEVGRYEKGLEIIG